MKKTFLIIGIVIVIIALIVIALLIFKPKAEKNIEGTVSEIMAKLYDGVNEDQLPMMLGTTELTNDTLENFVGTSDIDMKEAVVSESAVGSIAHSVVLIRLNNANTAEDAVSKIKENVNPRKWICVEATNVIVKSKGDLVILIMSDETLAPKIESNFDGLI